MSQIDPQRELKPPTAAAPWKPALVVGVALTFLILVLLHTSGLNGPFYWKWQWRDPRVPGGPLYLGTFIALLPVIWAQYVFRDGSKSRQIGAILLLMLGSFGLRMIFAAVRIDMNGLEIIPAIVQEPHMSSYYADAVKLWQTPLREWVSNYPSLMPSFHLHTMTKPPGTVLYWYTILNGFGGPGQHAAMIGGILLGAIACFSIPAAYLMLRLLLDDARAAFCGAAFLALCPGFIVFFPMYDPAYTILSAAMIGSWWRTLQGGRLGNAVLLGIATALTLIFAFNVLVIGIFMLGLIALALKLHIKPRLVRAAQHALVAGATTLSIMLIIWLAVGYNPVATFISAWKNQHQLLATYAEQRPYPATIWFDLADFALGSGWISFLLAGLCLLNVRLAQHRPLILLAIAQLLFIAVSGLLQSETSRVWNFMLPLLMIPVGLELSGWSIKARLTALMMLALVTAALYQNMTFLY